MTLREAYALLAVDPATASSTTTRAAFRAQIRRVHPDTVQSQELQSAAAERTRTLIEAYQIIKHAGYARPVTFARPAAAPTTDRALNTPYGIAVDGDGNVYVADWGPRGFQGIRKISPSGTVTNLAGGVPGYVDGPALRARFYQPKGIALDAGGNLYVCDSGNGAIRMIARSGVVSTLAGSRLTGYADGVSAAASFLFPHGLAADAAGNVYVADMHNNLIRKVAPSGAVTTLAGRYAPDSHAGLMAGRFADGPGPRALFHFPQSVAVDAAGTVYVADRWNMRIRAVSPSGDVTTFAGSTRGSDGAHFVSPQAVAVDGDGNVYVADLHRIRKITPTRDVSTLAGGRHKGNADGDGEDARFNAPQSIAVDGAGNVYVADTFNRAIRRITAAGSVSTLTLRFAST